MRLLSLVWLMALLYSSSAPADRFSLLRSSVVTAPVRLMKPRIQPLPEAEWTDVHRKLIATYWRGGDRVGNDFRTFLNSPEFVKGIMPFVNYISDESTLSPRDRELLILRTAWLCHGDYVWGRHSRVAKQAHLTDDELRRIARGPNAAGWDPFEATILRAADELHVSSFIDDDTWNALGIRYDMHHMMDAVMTVGEFTELSVILNSLGVQPDDGSVEHLPNDIAYTIAVPRNDERLIGRKARIPALEPSEWTPEVRAMLDPTNSGREVAATYRTLAQHPKLYRPRAFQSEHIRAHTTISPRIKEMLIVRIAALCLSEYQWGTHVRGARQAGLRDDDVQRLFGGPDGKEDPFDRAILRAVDEIYRDDFISDDTWQALTSRLDTKQMLDLLITTGGYYMNAMKLNAFGVQLEADSERFPLLGR